MASDHERAAPTPRDVAAAATRVGEPGFVDGVLHWLSTPPDGSGASVLYAEGRGGVVPCSPPDASLRSALHGYGAGSWCATAAGLVGVASASQSLVLVGEDVLQPLGADRAPRASEDRSRRRVGDPTPLAASSWVLVAEERVATGATACGLVAVDVATGERRVLVEVAGRCAEPAVDPAGRRVAWLRWPATSMPWDAAELWVAELDVDDDGPRARRARRVDGGPGTSAGQPTWRRDGSLAYVTEAAGFWQPWACDEGGAVRRLCARHAEFQRPRWLTCRWLAELADGALACAFADADGEHVAILHGGRLEVLAQPCVRVDGLAAAAGRIGWVGATTTAPGVVAVAAPPGAVSLVAAPPAAPDAPVPEAFSLVHEGVVLDGVRWPPTRRRADGAAPLVLTVHPGPTGAVDHSYAPVVHLLCAHGYTVAALDTSGSTAHGRRHRERLLGRFGELDVAECVAALRALQGLGADRSASFLRGTSAGGTTALLALATDAVAGAVAWYPASSLADEEDGFEAGYLSALTGPDGAARGPLARAGELRGAALVVQGADDDVVPCAESITLVAALREAGVEAELLVVPHEGHGFRTEEGRALALAAELAFYERRTVAGRAGGARYDAVRPLPAPAGGTEDP